MRLSDSSDPEARDFASNSSESLSLVAAPVEKDRETFFLLVAPVEMDRLPVCFAVLSCMPTSSSATIRDCARICTKRFAHKDLLRISKVCEITFWFCRCRFMLFRSFKKIVEDRKKFSNTESIFEMEHTKGEFGRALSVKVVCKSKDMKVCNISSDSES